MERSGLARWLFIGLAVFLAITFLPKLFGKGGSTEHQPLKFEGTATPTQRKPEALCDIWGPKYHAQLTSQGASIKHFFLNTAKYQHDGKAIDLATTPDVESRRQLRFNFRNDAVQPGESGWQVDFDDLDYDLVQG